MAQAAGAAQQAAFVPSGQARLQRVMVQIKIRGDGWISQAWRMGLPRVTGVPSRVRLPWSRALARIIVITPPRFWKRLPLPDAKPSELVYLERQASENRHLSRLWV